MKWFKHTKTTPEPTWKISTKVSVHPETILFRTRKKQSSFLEYFKVMSDFLVQYFRTVGWVVFSGLLVTFLAVVFTTPIFSLKAEKIELILEPEPVFDRAAVMTLMRDFAGKNIFRIKTKDIYTSLQSNVRHIYSVKKILHFPDGIRVNVTSFGPIYRAFINDEVFLLTKNGQLIVDIPEIEISALRIHTLASDPNGMQNTTLSTGDTLIIQEIEKLWYKELPNFPIEALDYFDQEKELHITSKGTRFIFTLSGGIEQLRMIALLMSQEKVIPQRSLYIDIRVPKKIYTCSREEASCSINLRQIYDL